MRKQAEQLVVGRVYADLDTNHLEPTFLRFVGVSDINLHQFTRVKGNRYGEDSDGIIVFPLIGPWYELTPEEDAIYNKPSEPTFTLSDIQRAIERIENEMAECGYALTEHGLRIAIEIMRDELKIDAKS